MGVQERIAGLSDDALMILFWDWWTAWDACDLDSGAGERVAAAILAELDRRGLQLEWRDIRL